MAFERELQDNLSMPLGERYDREMNPFRGLEFFDFEHAPLFYGRTKIVGEALQVLRQQATDNKPFVLVLGPASSGKTSLVRAGILPALTRVGITEGDRSWRLALTRPGNGGAGDPFDAIAAALLKKTALPEFPDAATQNGWQNLAAELREAPEDTALRLRETLQQLSIQAVDHFLDEQGSLVPLDNPEATVEVPSQSKLERVESKVQLALVVDQLEELFVGGFAPELQQKYIAALGALVKWRAAFVVATIRSDFYASFQKCCSQKDLALLNQPEIRVRDIDLTEILAGRFDLPPPSPQEIGEMIRLPAAAAGLRFELDPGTGENLDAALLKAATANAEPLPLLEHVLWQLYRKQLQRKDGLLRWSDYRELGEFEGVLANHAERVLSALDGDGQAALNPVVRQLVSPGPGEEGALMRRTVPYRGLVSTPEFSESRKTGAEGLIKRFIEEGLFHTETGPNAEVLVSVTQECLLRNWRRVRQLLDQDLGLLRARDRLEPNFKLWLSGGRRSYDLLRTESGIREAEALLGRFQTSLSDTQVEYLQESIKARTRRRRFRSAAVLAVIAGLLAPVVITGVQWLTANIERRKAEQSSGPEGRIAHSADTNPESFEVGQRGQDNASQLPRGVAGLATGQRDELQSQLKDTEANAQQLQSQLKDTEAKARQAQKDAELATSQRDALQSQLKELTQKNVELPPDQRDALQTQLNDAHARAQEIQKSLDLATGQRDALQTQLKDTEAKAQQAQKDAALASGQRDTLQTQLKDTEAKAQQGQKDAALASSQRDTLQTELKNTEAKAQQAQKDAELASSQRDALQAQLKDTEARAQQAQKSAAVATNQRDALQGQLKDTEAKAQQAQKNAELASNQRDALQAQLKDTEAKAQQAQKDAELASSQRDALQAQLKDTEPKAQQAQKDVELVASQRDKLQTQLKDTEAKAQQVQKDAALVANQRDALQNQAQQAQKNAELATGQREALQARLTDTEAQAQQAQKNADLAISQRDALQAQVKDAEAKVQQAQKDAALAANQHGALQDQPNTGEAETKQSQQDVEAVVDHPQPPQSAASEPVSAPAPATTGGENKETTARQNQRHRARSEPVRVEKRHVSRETRSPRNPAESTKVGPFSELRYQWNRFLQKLKATTP